MAEIEKPVFDPDAWASILINRWEKKLMRYKVGKSGRHYSKYTPKELAKSFAFEVINNAQGNAERITHTFNYYGKMLDMGVSGAKTQSGTRRVQRDPKPWYSKTYYAEVQRLSEIIAVTTGKNAALLIVENISNPQK